MADTTVHTIDYIVSTPGVRGGKPRIADRGIRVQDVAEDYQQGMTAEEIADAYELMPAEVHAALAYYYDHRAEIDRQIEEDDRFIEAMMAGQTDPNPLTERLGRLGLTLEQAHALIDYYHEHRQEVDRRISEAGLDDWPAPPIEKWVKIGLLQKLDR